MLRGLTNTKLLLILGGLVAIYFIVQLTNSKGRSKSFRSTLVDIDTADVSALEISKEGKTLRLNRVGAGSWQLELEGGKKVAAKPSAVKGSLQNLMSIKPGRLASKDPSKWKDYQVDSTGTRVKVMEDGEASLDIVLGRFGVKDQRSYHTFVRLSEDDEVYTADDFMGISFSTDAASFREQMFFRTKKDSIHTIRFNYADSAFTLTKVEGSWLVDNAAADSTLAADFIKQLNYTSSKNFVDDVDTFGEPVLSISVQANGEEELVLSGYLLPGKGLIMNSSLNPDAYFEDPDLVEKFLKSKSYFFDQG